MSIKRRDLTILASINQLESVTPSDVTDLTRPTIGLYVGVTGNVAVIMAGDETDTAVTLVGLAAGIFHPLRVKRVMSTNTTATSIVGGSN